MAKTKEKRIFYDRISRRLVALRRKTREKKNYIAVIVAFCDKIKKNPCYGFLVVFHEFFSCIA